MTREEREQLIAQYEAGADAVAEALKGFPEKDQVAHPIQGKWSAREIVHHLADSETNAMIRLRKLLCEEYPVVQPYDQDLWAVLLRYNTREIGPAMAAFRAARATSSQILRVVGDEDWKRAGWHPEQGLYTVQRWLQIYAEHAHGHAAQIRKLREALAK